MKFIQTTVAVLAFGLCAQAFAQEAEHRLGDHPAVIVKRMQLKQGYDYLAQFYPHPAWLYLESEAPHPMMDHPAVIVARQYSEQAQAESVVSHLARIETSTH